MHESETQIQNLMETQFQQNFQNQFSYSPFQKEPIDLEKNVEYMIQSQNEFIQSVDRLEEKMSRFVNTY